MATKTSIGNAARDARRGMTKVENAVVNHERSQWAYGPGNSRASLDAVLQAARDAVEAARVLEEEAIEYVQEAMI